ncbi:MULTISPECIES: ABC transporter ATP-binding protein [unclassified Mycolicibacterium]|uniref:ABC transporter ATP-binding protein n=2 Tax=Mycolicibacterium TaxID=1866885 RepID=UPI002815B2B1|nr:MULTISPECIES: ABC transporter ATP-binding protein [unclassified Mycolicibacterium]
MSAVSGTGHLLMTPAVAAGPALSLNAVSKRYRTDAGVITALDAVSLTVQSGEFVCIVGTSGCGKSTLLNLIAGLEQPTSGELTIGGRRVALMFQEPALFPWLTSRGNIELALRARGVARAQRAVEAGQLLTTVGLADFADARPHQLSGGMRQRVALARALAQDSDVLLMDEPFGALDAMTRDRLHEELERIVEKRGLTVIFVTHNVREAARLADRVIVLGARPGRIVHTFPVATARPRTINSTEVAELAARITARLHNQGAAHDGRR